LFLLAGLAVAVFALAWSEVGAPASSSRISRQAVLAQRGVVQSTVSGTGNVEAGTDVSVNFQASGTLADVFVKVGDHVSQGQLLATLDPTSAQLSVAEAEETLTAANDQLKAARQTSTSSSTSSTTTGASLQTNGGGSAQFVSETARQVPGTTTTTTTTPTRTQGTPQPRPKRKTSGKTTVPQTTTTTTTPAPTQAASSTQRGRAAVPRSQATGLAGRSPSTPGCPAARSPEPNGITFSGMPTRSC
jgi:multidrug efflux pump subunit AcrA (membrane-fusion protein)